MQKEERQALSWGIGAFALVAGVMLACAGGPSWLVWLAAVGGTGMPLVYAAWAHRRGFAVAREVGIGASLAALFAGLWMVAFALDAADFLYDDRRIVALWFIPALLAGACARSRVGAVGALLAAFDLAAPDFRAGMRESEIHLWTDILVLPWLFLWVGPTWVIWANRWHRLAHVAVFAYFLWIIQAPVVVGALMPAATAWAWVLGIACAAALLGAALLYKSSLLAGSWVTQTFGDWVRGPANGVALLRFWGLAILLGTLVMVPLAFPWSSLARGFWEGAAFAHWNSLLFGLVAYALAMLSAVAAACARAAITRLEAYALFGVAMGLPVGALVFAAVGPLWAYWAWLAWFLVGLLVVESAAQASGARRLAVLANIGAVLVLLTPVVQYPLPSWEAQATQAVWGRAGFLLAFGVGLYVLRRVWRAAAKRRR